VSPSNQSGGGVVIGPGPMTPAVRAIVFANVGAFVLTYFAPGLMVGLFGLRPVAVVTQMEVWRLATYLFIHDPFGFTHVLFNMLALWMFGVDLERRWGTRAFVRYYAITGIGAGIATVAISLLPFGVTRGIYLANTIGASGAIYGLLLAWALLFPHRQILFMFVFPLPARVAALLMGAMSFFSAVSGSNGSVAEATHLSGFLIGWLYLKGPSNLGLEIQYRLTKWRMARMRKRFDVRKGGRDGGDWGNRVH
jgi:membrane associated rhomboid family serine protease